MIETIDLNFQGLPQVIASYVLRGPRGVALIETGPATTYPALKAGLARLGIELVQVTDILVTHVHLDHAGAAGWLARDTGATVHVHAVGAPHLADPGKLLASARRIYGADMDRLWGETVAVPAGQVRPVTDGDVIDAAGRPVLAVDTPGHAWHHHAYLLDGLCFSGDVTGVRFPGLRHVRVPTPPPEIDLAAWRASLARLRELAPDRLLPTHFGSSELDTQAHLEAVAEQLEAQAAFVHAGRPSRFAENLEGLVVTPRDDIVAAYRAWIGEQAIAVGLTSDDARRFEVIVPSEMCVDGLLRYWQKQAG